MSCCERRTIGFRASIISANWLGGSPPARQVSARPSPFLSSVTFSAVSRSMFASFARPHKNSGIFCSRANVISLCGVRALLAARSLTMTSGLLCWLRRRLSLFS